MAATDSDLDRTGLSKAIEVLVVDDEPTSLIVIEKMVDELSDVVPVTAESGEEAIRQLKEREFALVIMDISMPGMSGFEVVEWLRQHEEAGDRTPVLFVTAIHKDDNSVARGYDLGVVDYLFKPIDFDILQTKVQVFTQLFRQRKELEQSRKQLQAQKQELTHSRERLLALFKHMPSGVAVYEPVDDGADFILRDMNSAGEIMSRVRIDTVRGDRVTELFTGVKDMGLLAAFRRVWKTGTPEYLPNLHYKDSRGLDQWYDNSVYRLPFGELVAVFNDVTERKQAESAVRESEERLSKVLDVVNEGIWDWRADTGETYFSPRYYTMLGYEVDEFPASYESFRDLVHPAERAWMEQEVGEKLKKGEAYDLELRLRAKDGEWRWIRTRGRAVEYDEEGSAARLLGTHVDITQEVEAREELKRKEYSLTLAQRIANVGSWIREVESGNGYWSDHTYRLFGFEPDEIEPTLEFLRKHIVPEDFDQIEVAMQAAARGDKTFGVDYRIIRKDGAIRFIESRGIVEQESDDGPVMYGVVHDVTERIQAEEALRKSEERYREAQRVARFGHWELDIASGDMVWSEEVFRIFGLRKAAKVTMDTLLGAIHPDDKEQTEEAFDGLLGKKSTYSFEHRIVKPDGEVRHVLQRGKTSCDTSGTPVTSLGTVTDITAQKMAEAALRESEQRHRSLFNSIRDGLLMANTDRDIIDINPAFTNIFGYTLDDLMGKKTLTVYESEEEFQRVGQLLRSMGDKRENVIYTVHYRKKSGEVFPGETSLFTLKDSSGEAVAFVGMIRDVSERNAAEQALRESEERWRSLLHAISAGVVVYDRESRIVAHNQAARTLMGLKPVLADDRVADESRLHLLRKDSSILPVDEYPAAVVLSTGEPLTNFVMGILKQDIKSVTWVLVNANPILTDDGEVSEVIVTFMDIGENIRKEDELKQRSYELEVLHELSSRLGYTLDYNDVIRLLIQNLSDVFEFDVAAGLVFDSESSKVFTQCTAELAPEMRDEIVERMYDAANEFSDACHLSMAEDTQDLVCTLPDEGAQIDTVKSSFIVPMFEKHGGVAGVLYVGSQEDDAFGADQIGLVFKVADQVGRSMRNLRALVDESIEELSQVLTAMPSGIVLLNAEYTMVMANPKGEQEIELLSGKQKGERIESLGGIPIKWVMGRALDTDDFFQVEHPGPPRRIFHIQGRRIESGPQAGGFVLSLIDITREREDAERIEASEERFRTLFDNASDAIFVIEPGGRIIDVNSVACQRLEYTRDELMQMTPLDIDTTESTQMVEGRIQAVLDKGFIHYETEHRRKDGSVVPTEVNAKLIEYDGDKVILATARNITERKQAEMERAEHEAMLNAMLTGIQASFVIIDPDSQEVVEANDQAVILLQKSKTEMLGQHCLDLLNWTICDKDNCEIFLKDTSVFLGQETTLTREDGTIVPVTVNRLKLRKAGLDYTALILFDITERKSLERQLSYAQKLESVGQLAAGIAHEINTPIQYVASNVSFLQKSFDKLKELIEQYRALYDAVQSEGPVAPLLGELDETITKAKPDMLLEEIPEAIADSQDGVNRVAKIVQAMKKFSHPDVEEMKLIDINDAVKNTVTVARNEWKYDSEMSLHLAKDLPMVECVPGDFNQAILNVLVNAAHANSAKVAKEGGKGKITISTALKGEFVEIGIEDSGTGISDDDIGRIFDPFFTTKEVGKGTGQGLAITHSIVDKHGGTITFDSTVGKGTTFLLRFPVKQQVTPGGVQ